MEGFLQISRFAGMREDLVQAGGGNSSYKAAPEEMVIKASGVQLADVTEETGYGVVNPRMIREAFRDMQRVDLMTEDEGREILRRAFIRGQRPSIETFLHSISGRYTLHTHPVTVNVLACRRGGMEILKGLFPEALMVPYGTPGVELAKKYFRVCEGAEAAGRDSGVVFLQNHGLVVSSDTAQGVMDKTESVMRRIESYLGCNFEAYRRATKIWRYFPEKVVWRVTDQQVLSVYHEMGDMWKFGFCPDCVVFLGKRALQLEENRWEDGIEEFQRKYGEPVVVICGDEIYLLADSVRKAMEMQSVLGFSAGVMKMNKGKTIDLLSDEEQDLLLNWEAEKYRKNQ